MAWANQILRERGRSLAPEDLYRITLLATGDKEAAADAAAEKALEDAKRAQEVGNG